MAVEVDGDVLEGLEGADDAFDADPGGLLEVECMVFLGQGEFFFP